MSYNPRMREGGYVSFIEGRFTHVLINAYIYHLFFHLYQEVDLLLNDGSKHINVVGWRKNAALSQRVETSRRRSRRCLLMSLALANSPEQQVSFATFIMLNHLLDNI